MTRITLLLLFLFASLLAVAQEWQTNGTSIYNTNSGNVGIGTATPSAKLDINGNLVLGDHSTDPFISFVPSDNSPQPTLKHTLGTGFLYNVKSGEGHYFQDGGSATNMFVGGNGNVGIGTVSPTARLEVAGATLITEGLRVYNSSSVNSLIIGTSNGLSSRLWLSADGEGDAFMYFRTSGGTYWTYGTDQSNSNKLNWSTGIGVEDNVKMTLDRSGNLGIGTSSPSGKLHVADVSNNMQARFGNTANTSAGVNSLIRISGRNGENTQSGHVDFQLDPADLLFSILAPSTVAPSNKALNVISSGNVGIGTTTPDSKLTVKGTIHTQEVKVDLNGSVAPDFVFEEGYALPGLDETAAYIKTNKHLPGIPSAAEMAENGIDLKEMNLKLLQKVEELTLHLIEQNTRIDKQQKEIENLRGQLK